MFQKILVAIDTSAIAKAVFVRALALAKATGASLQLLHVLSGEEADSPSLPVFAYPYYYPYMTDETASYREQWQVYAQKGLELLRLYVDRATAAGVKTESTQISGSPSRVICDLASTWGADLIIVGRRGHSGFSELLLGSVSNYVFHHSPCSVLIVQHPDVDVDDKTSITTAPAPTTSFKKILLAIDFLPLVEELFNQTLKLVQKTAAHLMLFHCISRGTQKMDTALAEMGTEWGLPEPTPENTAEAVQGWLQSYSRTATEQGVDVESSYQFGEPGFWICDLARDWRADLIVLGHRGRQGWTALFWGSVSSYVVHHASCSVLVISGQTPDSKKSIYEI